MTTFTDRELYKIRTAMLEMARCLAGPGDTPRGVLAEFELPLKVVEWVIRGGPICEFCDVALAYHTPAERASCRRDLAVAVKIGDYVLVPDPDRLELGIVAKIGDCGPDCPWQGTCIEVWFAKERARRYRPDEIVGTDEV